MAESVKEHFKGICYQLVTTLALSAPYLDLTQGVPGRARDGKETGAACALQTRLSCMLFTGVRKQLALASKANACPGFSPLSLGRTPK